MKTKSTQHTFLRNILAVAITVVLLVPCIAQATNYYWNCNGDSYWDITTCWNPNGTPTSTDNVYVGSVSNATMDTTLTIDDGTNNLLGNIYVNYLQIDNTGPYQVSMLQSAGSLNVAGNEDIGVNGVGSYTQNSDTSVSLFGSSHSIGGALDLGYYSGSSGVYNMGYGQLYAGYENIGKYGTGTFMQTSGTNSVTNDLTLGQYSGGFGWYDLTGNGLGVTGLGVTGNMYVGGNAGGSGGTGILSVSNLGVVSANNLTVWNANSSIGTGTTGTSSDGIIYTTGALTLTGGAQASSYDAYVGDNTTSLLNNLAPGIYAFSTTVSGTGTLWKTNSFYVGVNGSGTATVESNGSIQADTMISVGTYTGSNGTLNVNSNGTVQTSGDMYIGTYTGSNGTLNINSNGTVQTDNNSFLGFNGGSGTANISGSNALWTINGGLYLGGDLLGKITGSSGSLTVGYGKVTASSITVWNANSSIEATYIYGGIIDTGALAISGGGQANSYFGNVDSDTYASGNSLGINTPVATVTGTGSSWYTEYFNVGSTGTGTATVENGGTVQSHVDTYVGDKTGSNGVLNINAGGTVQTNGSGFLGYSYSGATGTVNVSGTGALWNVTNNLYVGNQGTGTLTVGNSGEVTAGSLTVGNANSTISTGTTGSSSDGIIYSTGTLTLSNGGQASSFNGLVDDTYLPSSGFTGIVANNATVTGTGSLWDTSYLEIGYSNSSGTATIENGGTVNSASDTTLGFFNGSSGNLNINADGTLQTGGNGYLGYESGATGTATVGGSNALWDVAGGLYVGGNASGSGGSGTLTLATGGTFNTGTAFELWSTGTLNMNGGTLNAGSLDNYGAFDFNAGQVNVTNDLSLNGFGTAGSVVLGRFDNLSVGGTTHLNDYSTLNINGGTFSTGYIADNGGFAFNSGTFNLTHDNLVIGSGGLFGANVAFDSTRTVNVTHNVTINSGAILGLSDATFTAGSYTNNGTVNLVGSVTKVGGGTFTNNGLLSGNGTVSASLNNASGGETRANVGDTLIVSGAGNTNDGTINMLGGAAQFTQGLTNNASGVITGHGALIANGGLTNAGTMSFTGTTDVQGNVNNITGGSIVVSGQTTTFYNNVVHNGAKLQVTNGATAVFLGDYSGAGSITGTGQVQFAGTLNPGNSPALVSVAGDMTLLDSLTTTMQLGGTQRGSQYDAFDVGGTLTLGGILDVTSYDLGSGLYSFQVGDTFDLFQASTITGNFNQVSLASLGNGMQWDLNYLQNPNGTDYVQLDVVAATPLPASAWLFGSGLLGLVGIARRKAV